MRIKNLMVSGLLVALITSPFVVNTASAAEQIYQMGLTYRTGPYAPNGVPFANGFADFCKVRGNWDSFDQAFHQQALHFTVEVAFSFIYSEQSVTAPADQVHLHSNDVRWYMVVGKQFCKKPQRRFEFLGDYDIGAEFPQLLNLGDKASARQNVYLGMHIAHN